MRKKGKKRLLLFGMIMAMTLTVPTVSHAYTEEEIAQAKAWLSAHGYSPDYGGASQAYQDYLNGKFDEELGVNGGQTDIPINTEIIQPDTETSESGTEGTEAGNGGESSTGSSGRRNRRNRTDTGTDTQNNGTQETSTAVDGQNSANRASGKENGTESKTELTTQDKTTEEDKKTTEDTKNKETIKEGATAQGVPNKEEVKKEQNRKGMAMGIVAAVMCVVAFGIKLVTTKRQKNVQGDDDEE